MGVYENEHLVFAVFRFVVTVTVNSVTVTPPFFLYKTIQSQHSLKAEVQFTLSNFSGFFLSTFYLSTTRPPSQIAEEVAKRMNYRSCRRTRSKVGLRGHV